MPERLLDAMVSPPHSWGTLRDVQVEGGAWSKTDYIEAVRERGIDDLCKRVSVGRRIWNPDELARGET